MDSSAAATDTPDNESAVSVSDEGKILAILGYFLPLLFIVPLLLESTKNNAFSRYHANQQLVFLLFQMIGYTVSALLMFLLIGFILMPIFLIVSLVFMTMGVINAAKEKKKPLPWIGKYGLLK